MIEIIFEIFGLTLLVSFAWYSGRALVDALYGCEHNPVIVIRNYGGKIGNDKKS